MKKSIYVILIALLLLLASCTNTVKAPDDSWNSIFLQYWNAMNNEYVHFSDDPSFDWDAVYDEYEPKFEALDYTNKEDSLTAFKYFKEIAVNVHDYHYNLKVIDAFGQSLSCSPAMLKKYKANGGDIMDFPDLTLVGKYGVAYPTSVNHSGTYYDTSDKVKEYKKAIPSAFEVETLRGKKYDDMFSSSEEKTTTDYFHNRNGSTSDEFGQNYYGYDFKSFDEDYISSLETKDDKKLALKWNVVVKAIGIESYFYGVTNTNVYYLYFSDFGNALYLMDVMTKDEKDMTEEEKELIASSSEIALLYTYTQDLIAYANETESDTPATDQTQSSGSSSNVAVIDSGETEKTTDEKESKDTETFKEKIQKGVIGIKNLSDMYANLLSATAEGKCNINNAGEKTGIKGVAIDLRGNGGGSVGFLDAIWGAFFTEAKQFGYVRYKSGYARNEYTPWTSFSLEKEFLNENLKSTYDGRVAVLVNGFSVSCSEVSCIISKLLPNSKIVGHTTFGGTCALTDRTVYNSGPFTSAHLSIYTTTYQFVDNDRQSYETVGIEPDIKTGLEDNKDVAYIAAVDWVAGTN